MFTLDAKTYLTANSAKVPKKWSENHILASRVFRGRLGPQLGGMPALVLETSET